MENPDSWVILKISNEDGTMWKILCSWFGGYLSEEEWRLSSQIEVITAHENHYEAHTNSGNMYRLKKNCNNMSGIMNNKLKYYQNLLLVNSVGTRVEVDNDWTRNF